MKASVVSEMLPRFDSIQFTSDEYNVAAANVHSFLEKVLCKLQDSSRIDMEREFADAYRDVFLLCTAKPPNNACDDLYHWRRGVLHVAASYLKKPVYDVFANMVGILFRHMESTYVTRLRLPTNMDVAEPVWKETERPD